MRHLFLCTSTLLYAAVAMPAADYHFGADISGMTPGATYKDHGVEKPALQVFRDNGYNWVRYRLWHTPTTGAQNLEYVTWIMHTIRVPSTGPARLMLAVVE